MSFTPIHALQTLGQKRAQRLMDQIEDELELHAQVAQEVSQMHFPSAVGTPLQASSPTTAQANTLEQSVAQHLQGAAMSLLDQTAQTMRARQALLAERMAQARASATSTQPAPTATTTSPNHGEVIDIPAREVFDAAPNTPTR